METPEIFSLIEAGDATGLAELLGRAPEAVQARNADGLSPLMFACYRMQWELVAPLRAAAGTLDVFEAAAVGDVETLAELLEARPSGAAAWTADGFTALHLAAFFRQPEAVGRLLEAGADPSALARNGSELRPLHSAAASGELESVRLLLDAGADPNAAQAGGFTPLHAAARHGHEEMAAVLLGAGADTTLQTHDGQTASDLAPAGDPVLQLLS